jgi:hypothetical protein
MDIFPFLQHTCMSSREGLGVNAIAVAALDDALER